MSQRLYELLPAVHRVNDAKRDEPLRALLGLIEDQLFAPLAEDIDRLYDDWFIETCEEWVVPYIGDLLGVRPLHPIGPASLRGYVANTLAYRQRKGTAAVLEQLARDVTGWPARAVEFFQLLVSTQHLNHLRPGNLGTLDLRDTNSLELLRGPFERASHTVEVRGIADRGGRYNIPNVGLFLWRLQSYPVERGDARPVSTPADGRYTFAPLGHDLELFNRPQTEAGIAHLAEERNVPGRLRRRPLYDELEQRRQALVDGEEAESIESRAVYFARNPVLEVFAPDAVRPEEITICNLQHWRRPPNTKSYRRPDDAVVEMPIKVAVDPVLGRLEFPEGATPEPVLVSYSYGFSDDTSGGPYGRRDSLPQDLLGSVDWQVGVTKQTPPVPNELFSTVAEAVEAWNAEPDGTTGVIAVMDSRTYAEDLTGARTIVVPPASRLLIVAAGWPEIEGTRVPGRLAPQGVRPHLRGDISVRGPGDAASGEGRLILNGLLVEGSLSVLAGSLGALELAHSTIAPGTGSLAVERSDSEGERNTGLSVSIERSICGPIQLLDSVPQLRIDDSIVDAGDGAAVSAPGAVVAVRRSTVFGGTNASVMEADDTIFTGEVNIARRQTGCLRFSSLPDKESRTPRRYACQPDLALKGIDDEAQSDHVRARLTPAFTSGRYGDPGYGQLSRTCAEEIRSGAEDGSEMGAFSRLRQPQREANLRTVLDQYMRFGLEAGLFHVT